MCVFLFNKASGCANAPSLLTGLAIVCARVRTMRRRQLWTNVHNPIAAAVKSECSQFNSSSSHNCARMSAIRDKIRDTGGIVIVKLLLDSVKGKNVADKGETLLLMTKAMRCFFLATALQWRIFFPPDWMESQKSFKGQRKDKPLIRVDCLQKKCHSWNLKRESLHDLM